MGSITQKSGGIRAVQTDLQPISLKPDRLLALPVRGFSLLEVLVALSIMAISLGVLYQTQIGATRNLSQSLAAERATLYGQSILANAAGIAADRETLEGRFDDGYRWQLHITPIEIPPPPPAEQPFIPMLQLDLDIFWLEGNKERQLHLQSLSRPDEKK